MRVRKSRRRGATLIEGAMVLPVLVTLIIGTLIGGAGVLANSQVAMLAGEGARYASVHGAQYAVDSGQPMATSATVKANGVMPVAAGLTAAGIGCTLTWNPSASNPTTVTVVVTYQWSPLELFPAMTLSSTAVMPVTY